MNICFKCQKEIETYEGIMKAMDQLFHRRCAAIILAEYVKQQEQYEQDLILREKRAIDAKKLADELGYSVPDGQQPFIY